MKKEQVVQLRNSTYVNRFLAPSETLHTPDSFFTLVTQQIIDHIRPTTVLVVGCDIGILVKLLREQGVQAWGVNYSAEQITPLDQQVAQYCQSSSPSETFAQRYDLIICLEGLSGLSMQDVETVIAHICEYTDDVLFSFTPFFVKSEDASCIQPPEYWAGRFAKNSFYHDLDFPSDSIFPWAMRLRKTKPSLADLVVYYEHYLWRSRQENQARRSAILGYRFEISHTQREMLFRRKELQHQIRLAQNEIAVMKNSRGWRMLEFLRGIRNRLGFTPKAQ
jgi:hypothetical protein